MALLRRALSTVAPQRRYGESDPFNIPAPGDYGMASVAGIRVNDSNALGLPTFWACVRILSGSIATLPLKVFTQDGPNRVEVVPQPQVIADPFAQASLLEGIEQVMISMILRGNAYAVVTDRDPRTLQATQLFVVPPDNVMVQRSSKGVVQYTVGSTEVDPDDMVHVKNMVSPGSLVGLSCLDHMRTALGAGLAAQEYASKYYANGALQSGFIAVQDDMDPDEARQTIEAFKARHTGLNHAHDPAILTGGATWQSMSVTPEQSQFLETRAFLAGEIATFMGVPPHLLGQVDKTTSWGTGIEIQGRAFVDGTLRTYLVRIERALSALLPPAQWVEFDTDSLTRADTATRFANYAIAQMNGFMSVNDVRAAEGWAPLDGPDGDTYYHLSTLVPLGSQSSVDPAPLVNPDNPDAGPSPIPPA